MLSPDPDNPNEQAVGGQLFDHRLFGETVGTITKNGQCYTSDYFSKTLNSSTLTSSAFTFANGEKVLLETF
jgi:hypothetical protein